MRSWDGRVLRGSKEKRFVISALLNSYLSSPKEEDQDPRGGYFRLELHKELKHHSAASLKDSEMEKKPLFQRWSSPTGQASPLLTAGL